MVEGPPVAGPGWFPGAPSPSLSTPFYVPPPTNINPVTLWTFVGSKNTDSNNGTTTQTVTIPAGVQGGDLIVVSVCFTTGGAQTTFSLPGFVAKPGLFVGVNNGHDTMWAGYRIAGGPVGAPTTDTSFTITYGANVWGESVTEVFRTPIGVGQVTTAIFNSAGGYQTNCPDPAFTPNTPADLVIFGYGGMNATVGTTATSFTGPATTNLRNFTQQGTTGNGGGTGVGWTIGGFIGGGATANQAVDPTDWVMGVTEALPSLPAAQPIGPAWVPGVGLPGYPLSTPFYSPMPADVPASSAIQPVSLTDAGTGTDALTIASDVALADSGVGADTIAIASDIVLSDSGVGADTLAIASSVAFGDSGTGTDSLTIVSIASFQEQPTALYGPGWYPGAPGRPLGTPFYVAPVDSQPTPGVPIGLADAGAGLDSLAIAADVAFVDSGTGTDTLSIASSVALSDSATGTDTLAIAADVGFSETGTATDSLSIVSVTVADLPTQNFGPGWRPGLPGLPLGIPFYIPPADSQPPTIPTTPITLADTGTGIDSLTIASDVGLADTGQGADALSIASAVALADTGAGADALAIASTVGLSDVGTGADSLAISSSLAFSETGTGTDSLSISIIQSARAADHPTQQFGPWWQPGLPGNPLGTPFYNPRQDAPIAHGGQPGQVSVGNAGISPAQISSAAAGGVAVLDRTAGQVTISQTSGSVIISNKKASSVKVDNES